MSNGRCSSVKCWPVLGSCPTTGSSQAQKARLNNNPWNKFLRVHRQDPAFASASAKLGRGNVPFLVADLCILFVYNDFSGRGLLE